MKRSLKGRPARRIRAESKVSRERGPRKKTECTASTSRRPSLLRHGAAAVEFAFIAPLMIFLTFGLIELGRLSMLRDSAIHATREGARVAIKPSATTSEISSRVEEELGLMGISGGSSTVDFTSDGSTGVELVTVNVYIPIAENSWLPNTLAMGHTNIEGSTTMRRESSN